MLVDAAVLAMALEVLGLSHLLAVIEEVTVARGFIICGDDYLFACDVVVCASLVVLLKDVARRLLIALLVISSIVDLHILVVGLIVDGVALVQDSLTALILPEPTLRAHLLFVSVGPAPREPLILVIRVVLNPIDRRIG